MYINIHICIYIYIYVYYIYRYRYIDIKYAYIVIIYPGYISEKYTFYCSQMKEILSLALYKM